MYPSTIDCTCVQIHFECCSWPFAEARILDTPTAEVQNLLLVKTSTELRTECMGCCCQLVFVIEVRLGAVFHRDQLLFSVYCMLLCGKQNYTNICLTAGLAYTVRMFPVHHFYVWSYFHILDGRYWYLVYIVLLCRELPRNTISFSMTNDQIKKNYNTHRHDSFVCWQWRWLLSWRLWWRLYDRLWNSSFSA